MNKWFKTKENVSYIVLPRAAFKGGENNLDKTHAFISIRCSGDSSPKILTNDNTLGFLSLQFDDIDSKDDLFINSKKLVPFSEQIAFDILDFWSKINPKIFIVHCDAGFSRSPAVAAALTTINGDRDLEYFTRYRPNMLVYRTIVETAQKLKSF